KQREIEDFTHTIAHDLKAPLRAIVIATNALREEVPDETRRHVVRILQRARETENMVHDLLGMMRIVSEPEPVGTVDLGAVTAQALEVLRPEIAARQVRVAVAESLPEVPGQATKLRHVVENLVGNAIRFVPARTGVVAVTARRHDGAVVL